MGRWAGGIREKQIVGAGLVPARHGPEKEYAGKDETCPYKSLLLLLLLLSLLFFFDDWCYPGNAG